MKPYMYILCIVMTFFIAGLSSEVMAQTQEPVDIELLAEEEANRYQELLKLEDWQVFYVDSTLKANFNTLQIELEKLHRSKVTNTSLFQKVKDDCWDRIDADFKKWFTEKQWAAYLKSGAAKLQKQREKRKMQK